jgi:hypothetical protein
MIFNIFNETHGYLHGLSRWTHAWKDLLNSFGARCAAKAKVGTTSPKIFGCCVLSKTFRGGMTGPADLIKGKILVFHPNPRAFNRFSKSLKATEPPSSREPPDIGVSHFCWRLNFSRILKVLLNCSLSSDTSPQPKISMIKTIWNLCIQLSSLSICEPL